MNYLFLIPVQTILIFAALMPAWYLLQVIVTHSPATVAHQEVHGNILPPPNCQKSRNRCLIPPNSGKFTNKFSHWRGLLYTCPAFIHWLSIIRAGHHPGHKNGKLFWILMHSFFSMTSHVSTVIICLVQKKITNGKKTSLATHQRKFNYILWH